MGVMSRDQVLAHIAAGRHQTFKFSKVGSATPEAVGHWATMYPDTGNPGAASAPSTSWANCTDLAGSIFHTNVSPAKRYLHAVSCIASQNCSVMFYDRLGHINLNANALVSTGNKTISTSALPRSMDTNDLACVKAWIEITEVTATTTTQISMNSYTNEGGTSGRAGGTLVFPATATNLGWMFELPMQAGDKGVQAISTINVSVASTTTGECNIMLIRELATVPVLAAMPTIIELPDLPRVYDGSSIFMAVMPATSAAVVNIQGKTVCVYDS